MFAGCQYPPARAIRESPLQHTRDVADIFVGTGVPDGPFVENLHSINGSIVGEGLCPLPFIAVYTVLITAE